MGSLGLVGDKATRRIGALSGGEKARVALAVFCLTPFNVLLLDEPTNHLDVDAVDALLDALDRYSGAVAVVSHDRSFCERLRATHVGYIADGACVVEERGLRASDFSETDRGVRNAAVATCEDISAAEAKAERAAERAARKRRGAAPKQMERLEGLIAKGEARLTGLDAEMVAAGADAGRALELVEERAAAERQIDEWMLEWENLGELLL